MQVAFDSSFVISLLSKRGSPERDGRIKTLMDSLTLQKASIIIPAPVLVEVLVGVDPALGAEYYAKFTKPPFRLGPFGPRAVIECADLLRVALTFRELRQVTKNKVKYDWMIVAIAKAESVRHVYHDDADVAAMCIRAGLANTRIGNLPLSVKHATPQLPFDG